MRQGYCYTCLAIGGYFGRVTKVLNLSKNFYAFLCLDQRVRKITAPKIMRSGPNSPQRRLIATNRRLTATNRRLTAADHPKSATNRPELVIILRLGLKTLKG